MSISHHSDATGRRPLRIWVLLSVAAAALAGCGGGSRQALIAEPAYVSMTDAQGFTFALQQRYLELSTRAYDRGDRRGADFYALRSIMAIEGKAVELLSAREVGLRGAAAQEADLLRLRMTTVFNEGARLYASEDAARAQALYDCWLREAGAGTDLGHAAVCHGAAATAVARLEAASRGAPRLMGESVSLPVAYGQGVPMGVPLGAPVGVPGGFVQQQPVVHSGGPAPYATAGQLQSRPYATYQAVEPFHAQRPSPSAPHDATAYGVTVGAPVGPTPQSPMIPGGVLSAPPAPIPGGVLSMPPQGLRGDLPAPQGAAIRTAPAAQPGPVMAPPSWSGAPAAGYVQAAPVSVGSAVLHAPAPIHEARPAAAPAPRGQDLSVLFPAPMGGAQPAAPAAQAQFQAPLAPPASAAPRPVAPAPLLESATPAARVTSPQATGPDAGQAMATAAQARPRGLPVFFEFASDKLTPEAEDILTDVAAEARRQGARRISIAGFTDSAGSVRYNQLLAMRRAQAVRASLERRLGSRVIFEVLPAGQAGQAVETADEVREAANRRVEVAILPN